MSRDLGRRITRLHAQLMPPPSSVDPANPLASCRLTLSPTGQTVLDTRHLSPALAAVAAQQYGALQTAALADLAQWRAARGFTDAELRGLL